MKYQPPRATRDAHRYVFLLLQQQQGHTVLQLPRGESRHSDREVRALAFFACHSTESLDILLTVSPPLARASKLAHTMATATKA